MANIAILLPRGNMVNMTKEVLNELNIVPHSIKVIETSKTLAEARSAIDQGAKIIVARGLQALLITKHTPIPLVSLTMTTSDVAMLITKGKEMLNKEFIRVAIIWYEAAGLNDLYKIASIMNAKLDIYTLDETSNIEKIVDKAIENHADIIVGGDTVNDLCQAKDVPTMFYDSTKESIRYALLIAKKMSYTADIEETYLSQFRALLDASHNHIYEIDRSHNISVVNRVAEDDLKATYGQYIGLKITDIYPDITSDILNKIIKREIDTYATIIHHKQKTLSVNLTPVIQQSECSTVIVSMSELFSSGNHDAQTMQKLYLNGYAAKHLFSKFETKSDRLRRIIEQAKAFAMSKSPICVYGQYQQENEQFCEAIHNYSLRKSAPFINVYCKSETLESLEMLFSFSGDLEEEKKDIIELAHHGTLVIHDYELLPHHLQHRILQQIKSSFYRTSPLKPKVYADVRYIFTTQNNPRTLFQEKLILDELYYMLSTFTLDIPPLNEREIDFNLYVEKHFNSLCETYHRHLSLSPLSFKVLAMKSWKGDLNQLNMFIERLVLTAVKKTIDAETVESLYQSLYPQIDITKHEDTHKSNEQIQLENMLKRHNGNRQHMAEELNISTTTLWRKLKKYHLA